MKLETDYQLTSSCFNSRSHKTEFTAAGRKPRAKIIGQMTCAVELSSVESFPLPGRDQIWGSTVIKMPTRTTMVHPSRCLLMPEREAERFQLFQLFVLALVVGATHEM